MSLASLREVYNPLAIKAEQKPPLQDWRESTPVILLSEYLKINKTRGIILRQTKDGIPCLAFIPGLINSDKENGRWQIAENAEGLFMDAADDLKKLIAAGKLELPDHNHNCTNDGKNINEAGPSHRTESTGVSRPQYSNTFKSK